MTTSAFAAAYRDRIAAAVPEGVEFTPLMTAYLTDETDADDHDLMSYGDPVWISPRKRSLKF